MIRSGVRRLTYGSSARYPIQKIAASSR
jgi:hypothetical protein